MKTLAISVKERQNVGKSNTRALRNQGNVPCVLYGGEKQVTFYSHENDFRKIVYTPDVFIVELNIDGTKTRAIMQDIQFHPVTDKILHIDFLEVFDNKPITVSIPVILNGIAIGVKDGGNLMLRRSKIVTKGLINNLPDAIELNIEHLKIGMFTYIKDVNIEGCEFLAPGNSVIVGVKTARAAIEELVVEQEGAEDAEGTEGEGATTINYYDPRLTENIVDCLTFLNGFSLIKIISWIRHESMDHITAMIHKYKTNGDITKMKEEIGSCMFYYMLTIQLVVSISVYGFFYLIFIYLGFFGFIHRIKGVSFVGYVEPSQWNQIQLIEFCAFLNNILSLDTGKKRTFQSILNFLFTGEDAMEDDGEKYSQDSFKRLLISYSISKQGLIKTILVFTQLTHNDIQRICVIENYNTLDINDNNDNNDNNDIEEPTENDGEEIDDNDISIEGLIDMQNISKMYVQ